MCIVHDLYILCCIYMYMYEYNYSLLRVPLSQAVSHNLDLLPEEEKEPGDKDKLCLFCCVRFYIFSSDFFRGKASHLVILGIFRFLLFLITPSCQFLRFGTLHIMCTPNICSFSSLYFHPFSHPLPLISLCSSFSLSPPSSLPLPLSPPSLPPSLPSSLPHTQCFEKHNTKGDGGIADYPLCSAEMVADMLTAKNTESCFRRGVVGSEGHLMISGVLTCNTYTCSCSIHECCNYRIAGNVCGNYILRFVVNNEVCGFIVCGLLDTIYTGYNNSHTYYTA